ncbi:hypothetical protein ACTXK0_07055 [Corynebacterium variabile]|uniref:hypothetical protein n=1 Tax=Corynebacterium variabile TaxID=1727 RepID=UPI003F90C3C6
MSPSLHRRRFRRRAFLAGTGAAGAVAVGGAAAYHFLPWTDGDDGTDNDTPTAVDPGDLQLRPGDASHPGRVTVATADGRDLVHLDGYRLTAGASTGAATTTTDDPATVHLDYEVTADGYTATVTWRATGGTVTGDWEFRTPEDADLADARVLRTLVDATAGQETHVPATRWARDPRGGVPYLERVTENHFITWAVGDSRICGVTSVSGGLSNDVYGVNAPAVRGEDGVWRATVTFRADPTVAEATDLLDTGRPMLAGAVLGHPDLPDPLVDVRGPETYNVFTGPGTRTFTVGVAGSPGTATVEVLVHGYDGTEVHRSTVEVTVPDDARHGDTTVDVDLPDDRNWYGVEVTCGDTLARAGAAVWPDHDFGPAEGSIVGLGGFSAGPAVGRTGTPGIEPADGEHALWHRLGVRHLRNPWLTADEARDLDIRTGIQPAGTPGQFDDPDAQSFDDWAAEALDRGGDSGVELYELLNEWNANTSDAAVKTDHATEYTEKWLKPFRTAMDRAGSSAALVSQGLAGWDAAFLDTVRDRGGWDLLDGIAVHPGRGNYTADYDRDQWNFLGQVRKARAYLDGHPGPDRLWLTEVYTCTQPNNWWNDSPRTAADAVFLSLLLAKTLDVAGVHWYQLTDGLWYDKYGVDPANSEYHYGLFDVDRTPKPSAVAFAHAAEVLDGASFLGWVESPHPDLRGLRFARDGQVTWVLWGRQDGYVTNATRTGTDFFPFPEAWEVPDGKTLQVTVPVGFANGDMDPGTVTVHDVLGRDLGDSDLSQRPTGGPGRVITVGSSPVVVTGDIDEFLTGPSEVAGDMSVALTGVAVHRDGTRLTVDGVNDTGGRLVLKVLGHQVDGVPVETELPVPSGEFSETVDLGAAMPDEEAGPTASTTGVAPGNRPQVRILAERSEKLTPEASQPQVWRAEYHRDV